MSVTPELNPDTVMFASPAPVTTCRRVALVRVLDTIGITLPEKVAVSRMTEPVFCVSAKAAKGRLTAKTLPAVMPTVLMLSIRNVTVTTLPILV